jgi:hypothetical protein
MTTKPIKSRLTFGSWLGVGGVAAMLASLMLGIAAPELGKVFVWLAGSVALIGAGMLLTTGLTWYRKLKAREIRDEAAVSESGEA